MPCYSMMQYSRWCCTFSWSQWHHLLSVRNSLTLITNENNMRSSENRLKCWRRSCWLSAQVHTRSWRYYQSVHCIYMRPASMWKILDSETEHSRGQVNIFRRRTLIVYMSVIAYAINSMHKDCWLFCFAGLLKQFHWKSEFWEVLMIVSPLLG